MSDGDGAESGTGHESIVHEADVEATDYDHGDRIFRRKRLGRAAGSDELGASLYELEPGRRTWPAHFHTGNEEALYVLAGRLRLWLGTGEEQTEHELPPGSYVALPADEDHAHECEAIGEDTARFLAVSTMNEPDVTVYPEKNAVGLFTGTAPGGVSEERTLSRYLDLDAEVDYWKD